MSESTKIQWCHHTWNRWRGCRKVAPECENCYIVHSTPLRTIGQEHGAMRVEAGNSYIQEPIKWNKKAMKARMRRRVFCQSLGDWLDMENVPLGWWLSICDMVRITPWLDWLLLTKRPQNFAKRMREALELEQNRETASELGAWLMAWEQGTHIPHNVWIGVSAGVDPVPALDIPAAVHFLSCEPMIQAMDTTHAKWFDWIIVGGESGPNAREMNLGWMVGAIKFCRANNIPIFVKQMGENPTALSKGGQTWLSRMKDKKGGNPDEWPIGFQIRQFPNPPLPPIYDPQTYFTPETS